MKSLGSAAILITDIEQEEEKKTMNLKDANAGETYIVEDINTDDEDLKAFLFSLGCYSGEPITVIAHLKGGCTVSIKDGRYNIDNGIAETVLIK